MKISSALPSLTATIAIMTQVASAQPATTPMAELMRSEGRIYVVIAVMLTILGGLLLYLVRLDRKISNLEKE
ncbi:MAG: CcmD family protein [Chitinophagia bacterium]|jgi:CcmD family protein|nr:CcmD family protein [Chitinophagia bacterium]